MYKIKEIVKKNKNLLFFLIPIVILSIILLSFWPGIHTYDGNNQWQQVLDNSISNSHPFFSTFFVLILSKIWSSQIIIVIFQIIVFTIIWGNICKELDNEKKNTSIILIYTILLCLFPIISMYAITVWKDILYSYYLLALIYFLYIGSKNDYNYTIFQKILIGILIFLVFSYRHNGMIVGVLLLIVFFFLIIKNKANIKKFIIVPLIFVLLLVLISFPKSYYLSKNVESSNKSDTSTIDYYMTWIMGSHIKKGYVEDDDLEFLNNYIEIDEWKNVYDPYLVNSTNLAKTKNNKYINDNIDQFRQIFIKYTLKHPLTLAEHYLKSDALLWSPFPIGYVYQYDFKIWGPDYGFNVRDTSKFPLLNKCYEKAITITMRKPIRIILYQPATIMYISIFLTFILVKSLKNKKLWVILIPMVLNIISLLPINVAQDLRYVYINYLTLSFVGILVVVNYKDVLKYIKTKFKRKKIVS